MASRYLFCSGESSELMDVEGIGYDKRVIQEKLTME